MSGRFTRQQRRKRWADTGIVFPQDYVARVSDLASCDHPTIAAFAVQLRDFAALSSTYDEVAKFKSIAGMLSKAAQQILREEPGVGGSTPPAGSQSSLSTAVDLFLELLFLENSRPLHSHLLTTCIRLPPLPSPNRGAPGPQAPSPPRKGAVLMARNPHCSAVSRVQRIRAQSAEVRISGGHFFPDWSPIPAPLGASDPAFRSSSSSGAMRVHSLCDEACDVSDDGRVPGGAVSALLSAAGVWGSDVRAWGKSSFSNE